MSAADKDPPGCPEPASVIIWIAVLRMRLMFGMGLLRENLRLGLRITRVFVLA